MPRVSCENRACRLCKEGSCSATHIQIVFTDDELCVDCPEFTVKGER